METEMIVNYNGKEIDFPNRNMESYFKMVADIRKLGLTAEVSFFIDGICAMHTHVYNDDECRPKGEDDA